MAREKSNEFAELAIGSEIGGNYPEESYLIKNNFAGKYHFGTHSFLSIYVLIENKIYSLGPSLLR